MRKILLLFFIVSLASCTSNEEDLLSKISSLESQLDDCQNGPEKLSLEIKNAFDANEFSKVKAKFEEMKTRHSGSIQYSEALEIYNSVIEKEEKDAAERERKIEEEKAEKLKALNRLKKRFDDVSGITWYSNPYFTHYSNTNLTSIYMGQKDGSQWLRLEMSYKGSDWIFFDNAYLSYEGNTKEFFFNKYSDKQTENSGGSVWEWIDVQLDDSMIPFMRNLANSSEAKMRLSGKYTKTRNLSQNERKAILDVLNGYEALKSTK